VAVKAEELLQWQNESQEVWLSIFWLYGVAKVSLKLKAAGIGESVVVLSMQLEAERVAWGIRNRSAG